MHSPVAQGRLYRSNDTMRLTSPRDRLYTTKTPVFRPANFFPPTFLCCQVRRPRKLGWVGLTCWAFRNENYWWCVRTEALKRNNLYPLGSRSFLSRIPLEHLACQSAALINFNKLQVRRYGAGENLTSNIVLNKPHLVHFDVSQ